MSEWVSRVYRPTRHSIGHFGGSLHSQSLDWYWQTKQYRKINTQKLDTNTVQENKNAKTKYKSNKTDKLKYRKTKLPWFSHLLRHGQETRWVDSTMITHMGPETHTGHHCSRGEAELLQAGCPSWRPTNSFKAPKTNYVCNRTLQS